MKKFAVFDIDGTLLRWQLYHGVVNLLAKDGLLGEGASKEIKQAMMKWKHRESPEEFSKYEAKVIEVFNRSMQNLSISDFEKTIEKVVAVHKEQTYSYTSTQVSSLKAKGYKLLAISGSSDEMVGHVAKHYGFDDWVGAKYERKGDRFTGKQYILTAENKIAELEKMVKKHNLSYEGSWGFGDSQTDSAFLAKVENPVAFNPNQELYKIAKQKGWDIVIERKNVIYKIEAKNGSYILA